MLLKLLMTLCLVGLATSIGNEPFPILRTLGIYPSERITLSSRVKPADLRLYEGPHYYIPTGECLGYLNTTHLCGNEPIKGIQVKVSDPHDFAMVKIHPKRGKVRILRHGRIINGTLLHCPGAALVDLRLSCDHWQFSHSRNRLRLPSRLDSNDDDVEDASEAASQ